MIESAYMSLWYKAQESLSSFPMFIDTEAVRVAKELLSEIPKQENVLYAYLGELSTACRAKLINDAVKACAEERVLNLGCGFDMRGHMTPYEWVDVDLPEVMTKRCQYLSSFYKGMNIAADIFDPEFLTSMTSDKSTLIILEGVLDYYSEDKVLNLLSSLKELSPSPTIVFDSVGSLLRGQTSPTLIALGIEQKVEWGLDDPRDLGELGFMILDCTYVHEVEEYRWKPLEDSWKKQPLYKSHSSKVIVMKGVEDAT